MLVQYQGWIYSVVKLERVFDETLAVFDEYAELFRSGEGCLFKSPGQQANILVFGHKSFDVLRVDSLHAP